MKVASKDGDPLLDSAKFFATVEEAISRPRSPIDIGSEGFDAAGAHVLQLLADAASAYERSSYGTAAFLAVTALEETAKAEIVLYRPRQDTQSKPKGRDPLRDHARKHVIAVRPTVFMGERLKRIIGRERCEAIRAEAESGGFTALREAAIYVDFEARTIMTPREAVPKHRAFEVLLVALASADDILVGYTNRSYDYGKQFVGMMEALERSHQTDD